MITIKILTYSLELKFIQLFHKIGIKANYFFP